MRRLLIVLLSVLVVTFLKAQPTDKWQICFNKQSIFNGNSDQINRVAFLKLTSLKKKDCITIRYETGNADTGWKRTFFINDSADREIKKLELNKQSGSVSVNATVLKAMLDKKLPVFIYTTSLPKDPAKAAVIRIRRLLLCKLDWN